MGIQWSLRAGLTPPEDQDHKYVSYIGLILGHGAEGKDREPLSLI